MRSLRAAFAVVIALLVSSPERLLAQDRPLPYWQHSQWIGDNAPPISASFGIRRSADGYLWLGATNGLIRFDGIRFTILDSTNTAAFRGIAMGAVTPHVLDRNGVLWFSTFNGQAFSYANGVMRRMFAQEADTVRELVEDGSGRLWANTSDGIRLVEKGKLVRYKFPAGLPERGVLNLKQDASDGLWIGTARDGLYHVRGSAVDHIGTGSIRVLIHGRDGNVWGLGDGIGKSSGLSRLIEGQWEGTAILGDSARNIVSRVASEGPDGSVWFVSPDRGLLRWYNGRIERFTKDDGLSNNRVREVYADPEGSVWVLTDAGVDRLRPATFATIEKRSGLPISSGAVYAVDKSGAVWLSMEGWVYRIDGGIVRNAPGAVTSERFGPSDDDYKQLIGTARSSGVWVGPIGGGIYRLDDRGNRVDHAVAGFPASRIGIAHESRDGTLWLTTIGNELGFARNGKYTRASIYEPGKQTRHMFTEDSLGRMWFVSDQDRVTVIARDSIVRQFDVPLRGQLVTSIATEAGDTAWLCTYSTLVRIIGTKTVEVTPPHLQRVMSAGVHMVVSRGSIWMSSLNGFARIRLKDLHRAADSGTEVSAGEIFGPLDGVGIARSATQIPRRIRVGPDGRVWFPTPDGLAVADPSFEIKTRFPRRILIEELFVGDSALPVSNGVRVPSLPSRVSIRFTVPTALLAERVRMQYRLDGADDRWVDATVPRIATYNQLRAGDYTFRVRAWNEGGQPIPEEATLTFRVQPTWYQSWWFAVLVGLTGAAIILVLYRLRVRELRQAYNVRLEERWAERTRIARELHDTLLQNFQGLMFRLQAVREMLPAQSEKAIPILDTALLKGEEAIDRARTAVSDLRSPEKIERDFDAGLTAIAAEAVHLCKHETVPSWSVDIKGRVRDISPVVLYELYQITQEAIGNAFQHSKATHVQVDVRYGFDDLRVTVTDDGIGFDDKVMASVLRPGHFGLQGMMERIEKLGGRATLSSKPGEGTSAIMSVPGTVAFRKEPRTANGRSSRPARSRSESDQHE